MNILLSLGIGYQQFELNSPDDLVKAIVDEYGPGGAWEFGDEIDNWTTCEITGSFADCVTALYTTEITA